MKENFLKETLLKIFSEIAVTMARNGIAGIMKR
jgi:hypothetical protein